MMAFLQEMGGVIPAFLHGSPSLMIATDMTVALILGFLFGYERSYHGRAAGMRTYGLVCMVSAALVSVSSHPEFWFSHDMGVGFIDPTRTIQGIVTGIGFLGAGIIMQNGLTISGLTTAASIWASAAIGVLVGLGFYGAALWMTVLAEVFVMMGMRFDALLPSRRPVAITLQFRKGVHPHQDFVRVFLRENGYDMASASLTINRHGEQTEWRFVAISINRRRHMRIEVLAEALGAMEGVEGFHLSRARN